MSIENDKYKLIVLGRHHTMICELDTHEELERAANHMLNIYSRQKKETTIYKETRQLKRKYKREQAKQMRRFL